MNNKQFGKTLENRTKKFAISILKLSTELNYSTESKIIKNQISKSGTSIGANYREANRSRSRADFLNKVNISKGEANETVYWLEIIEEMQWVSAADLKPILKEANELLALFTAIAHSGKSK